MSFDRFLAVCFPLHYTSIMSHRFCFILAAGSWVLGFLTTSFPIIRISQLYFCSGNVINHFFCESAPLLKLSCSNPLFQRTHCYCLCIFSHPQLSSFNHDVLWIYPEGYIENSIHQWKTESGIYLCFTPVGRNHFLLNTVRHVY
ncbi:unnamed protein product [Staurois parvus]|uniref:G-protein coupled receptors family 1 profile domain-containing protein n=1 Tax=Staurois parvus TaxID=386267 RepID=A0ABN9GDG1_9NEOB|nr:unnamed protein product [Staurois parvus]